MRLYHPVLDVFYDFGTEASADVFRQSGWIDPPKRRTKRNPDSAAAEIDQPKPQQED